MRRLVPALQLFQRLTEVLEHLTVDVLDLAVGRKRSHQAGNAVHDQARLALAFVASGLGALALVDVDVQKRPARDTAFGVAKRHAESPEPAIDAVEAEMTLLVVVPIAARDRMLEALDRARTILGMNG